MYSLTRLKLRGQVADATRAARGATLFHDGSNGSCFDWRRWQRSDRIDHLNDTDLYLSGVGSRGVGRKGRRGVTPAFDGTLPPEDNQGGVGIRVLPGLTVIRRFAGGARDAQGSGVRPARRGGSGGQGTPA